MGPWLLRRPWATAFAEMTKENAAELLDSFAVDCERGACAYALSIFASGEPDPKLFKVGCRGAFQARMARTLAHRVADEVWDSIPEIRAAALWLLTPEPFEIWWAGRHPEVAEVTASIDGQKLEVVRTGPGHYYIPITNWNY